MSSVPATEFPRFLELPFEIRWAIYQLCLPKRVVNSEIRDLRGIPKQSINREERLALMHIVAKFGRTPVIARASPEVYRKLQQHVVTLPHSEWVWSWHESGRTTGSFTDPRPVIFNPRSDVLFVSPEHRIFDQVSEEFLHRSPYYLASSQDAVVAIDYQTTLYLSACKWLADYCFLGRKNCIIVLDETKFVSSMEWIASCGLFGLCGEERTVFVDVDDFERIDYFDRKLNGKHTGVGGPAGYRVLERNAPTGIRRYSSHGNVESRMRWDENSPLVSAEERAEVIAKDKKEILRQIKMRWLGVNGCFKGTELDNPCFVPSQGKRWATVFDEEHPNAKVWLDKLPAFSFAVRVHAHHFEEETRRLCAKRARLMEANNRRPWADMPLSVASFSWTN